MKPDTSKWDNPSAYDFIKDSAADSIAWEFLRRNKRYQKDYRDMQMAAAKDMPSNALDRWGLSFRGKT
ncbi:transcriptional regulator domain-containing protein [Mesorhizobium australicum]|uniref:Transcriptional regulator-like domain-containing protein n=1 Tax=Mesorhizobium australicum TaxID=536018 RepID=A0A1X7NTK1_9HYPH|nr:DUF6499 domain-containing protein [Mesorhizobium australicum]SMH40571.1 hypothetical protein SAMN02982922_2361 [Mesorhizobium australicum]